MVAIAFLAQSFGVGITTASYGPLLTTIQQHFGTSRGLASSGTSLAYLTLCLLAPLVGDLAQRWSIRRIMILGTVLNAIGHFLLSMAGNIYVFLGIYAVFIGPGLVALGIIPGPALISRWFVRDRGKALGIANMQAVFVIIPLIASFILLHYGLANAFRANAIIFLLFIPVLLLVVDRPEDIGQLPRGVGEEEPKPPVSTLRTPDIFRRPEFWLMTAGVGIMTATSVVITTHVVALLIGKGYDQMTASKLLSVYGVAGVTGALVLGWLSDRLGPMMTFALCALAAVLPWFGMMFLSPSIVVYAILIAIIGICNGGIVTLHAGTINELFGRESVSKVMGLGYFFKLPFLFAAAPLTGYAFDLTGSYNSSLAGSGLAVFGAGVGFAVMRVLHLRRGGFQLVGRGV